MGVPTSPFCLQLAYSPLPPPPPMKCVLEKELSSILAIFLAFLLDLGAVLCPLSFVLPAQLFFFSSLCGAKAHHLLPVPCVHLPWDVSRRAALCNGSDSKRQATIVCTAPPHVYVYIHVQPAFSFNLTCTYVCTYVPLLCLFSGVVTVAAAASPLHAHLPPPTYPPPPLSLRARLPSRVAPWPGLAHPNPTQSDPTRPDPTRPGSSSSHARAETRRWRAT